MDSSRLMQTVACVTTLVLAACTSTTNGISNTPQPFRFTAAAGTFYKDYTGPQRASIDAIGADGSFSTGAQTITVVGKMAGPVLDGNTNYYVWGFDRGGAAAGAAPFPDEPNIKFNAVLLVTANANGTLTAVVNLLNGAPPQPAVVTLSAPDTIQAAFAAAQMPSTGFTPDKYVWNLWPRSAVGGSATAQIASFIPDNTMASLVSL
jgi:hypothetical protein